MTVFQLPLLVGGKDPLAWLDQAADSTGALLDPTLRDLDFDVSGGKNPIGDDDQRQYCDEQVGRPGFEHLCTRLAKDGTSYCRTHQRHHRPVQLVGAER